MESILPFCAASVSPIRRGKANWPICMSWMVLLGCCRTDTLTILLSFTTSWIWTGPYIVSATFPVTVCSPAGRPVCWPVVNPWPPEDDPEPDEPVPDDPEPDPDVPPDETPVPLVAAAMAGTCDLNDRRATRPAMVLTTARMARRISAGPPFQNWNDSKWMCRFGTPAACSASTAAEVMPSGPQTYTSCRCRPGTSERSIRGDSGSPPSWARDPTR